MRFLVDKNFAKSVRNHIVRKRPTVDLIPSNPKNILKSKGQKQRPSVKMPFVAKIY